MNIQIAVYRMMQTIVDAPIWCLLLLKLTAILAAAWLLHLALARLNPRWRVLLWRVTAVGLVAMPAIVWLLPAVKIHFQPPPDAELTINNNIRSQNNVIGGKDLAESSGIGQDSMQKNYLARMYANRPFPGPLEMEESARMAQDEQPNIATQMSPTGEKHSFITTPIVLLAVWLAGVAALALRFFIGYYRVRQIAAGAKIAPEWVRGECRRVADRIGCRTVMDVLQSGEIQSPFLCGILKSKLLLPERMCQVLYREDLPGIFAHELTHVCCRDMSWNAFMHLISILLWFHPLAWRLRKAHLSACEMVCDAVSAGFVGDVNEYCRTLARVAIASYKSHPAAGIAMAKFSTITRRLNALKKHVFHRPLRRRYAISFGVLALFIVIVLGIMQLAFAQPSPAETANQPANKEATITEKDAKTSEKDAKARENNAKSKEKQEKKADSSPKTGPMQVRVIDENGKALPNTELTVLYRGHKSKVSTDKEGKAVIDVPLPDAGYMHLYASPEGYPPIRMIWRNESGNETVPGEFVFTFEQGKTIGGTVRDEQGKPVKDAKIYLNISAEKYEGTNMCVALWDIPILTDSEGKWRLDHAPEKIESMSIRLEHPDYIIDGYSRGVTEQEQIKIENGSSVMILKKGIPLTGTVTDYEGKPVADALVALGKERFGQDYPITRTDKDGRYSFGNLAPGDTALTVVSRGLAPALRQINVQPKMKVVDFHLEKGKTIKLRVVDKDDKPVEGVNISPGTWLGYRTLTPDTGIAGKTDKEGRWAWTWAPKEAVEMSVYKSGYMNVRNLELTPQENEYVITLKKPLTITGKVVDAETKQIIPNIKIVKGYIAEGDNENRNVFWARHEILESNDGRYKVVVSSPFKGHFVRIEAEGYKPGISREFKSDEGDVTYDFAMSKGDNLNVTVLLPDGKPAVGADVRLCPAPPGKFYNMATFIKNGRFSYSDSSAQKLTLAADGRLSIAPQNSEFMLVIVHDQGFAKTTSQALKAKPQIKLEAWARLEGVVKHGTKTLPNIKLDVYESGGYDPKWSFLNFQDQTETDAEGKFFYPKLLPGKWFVRVLSSNEPEITALFPRPKLVELTAGQTTSVTLGGVGRPVIGKIQWPDGKPPEGDLSKIGASLCTKLPERPRPPKEVIAQGPDAYRQWNITWESTDEGKAWLKAAQTAGCGVGVQVKPDGSFRFEGVMPGKYELSIWLMKADVDNLPWEFPETLRYTADCIVPEVPGGVSDEPLDLGAVQLKDASGKELPTTPVKTPAPQAPGEKSVGTMIDHFELLRYVVATNRENTEKIKTWQGKANIQSRSIFIHSGTPTGTDYSATVQFVFDRAKKSIRWNNTLNRYSRINNGVDDPQPVPQIINGMLTPEAFYRYGYYDSPGNPATQKLNLWIHSFTRERINRYQFDFNPLDYLETGRGKVSKDIAGYMKIIDHPGITGIKIIREGDNVTIEFGLRGNIQYYTVSLSQGCNPIHMEIKEPNSTWQYRWTYENVDGIWLPKTWTESVHEKDQRDEESKVTFVENVVNRPVAAGAFSLSSLGVKPGDNVQDRRVDPIRQYNYEEEK